MRQAEIYFKGKKAGTLTQLDSGSFVFRYTDAWMLDSNKSGISVGLPKSQREYRSESLFPFFYNMLPEGTNKQAICRKMRIDENDHFGLLLTTAQYDSIGAITVKKVHSNEPTSNQ